MRRGRRLIGAWGLRALALLLLAAGPSAFAATGTVNLSTPPQQTKRERRPSPTVESLPVPAVSGPLRILLVDDDYSDNNHQPGDPRESPSDTVFRRLAADAVGGDAASWSIETVKTYANGPGLERLRRFSLILWYTGPNYGGGPDNTSVLSIEDEKTVRRYLEEVGGVVVLFSPGYASKVFGHDSTKEESSWPFLYEVLGIRGGYGLAKRFEPGAVSSHRGVKFQVGKGGVVETQFSFVNPDGSAVVFTAALDTRYSPGQDSPVATAFSYGRGRIIYVGFTFENVAADQALAAFQEILNATGLTSTLPAPSATLPVKTLPAVVQSGSALRPTSPAQVVSPTQEADPAQAFSLQGSDRQSFNFYISNEGPIRLQVQATGAPVAVTVFHPDGRTNTQSGQGSFVVGDKAEAADLARGHVWAVSVRLSSPTPNRSVVASGSIIVSHPPSDEAAVRAQLAAAKPKTTVLGKAPPLRIVSSMPEAFRVSNVARPVGLPPAPAPPVVGVKRPPIGTIKQTVPAPVARFEVAGPPGQWSVPAAMVGVREALYVAGTDLLPPGISTEEFNSHPQQYAAELHFEYGDGQSAISPLAPAQVYGAIFLGRVPAIPGVVDVPVSVFVKTADGRVSNRSALVYHPWLVTKVVGLPIVDYNEVNNVTTAPFNFLDWIWGYKTGVDPDFRLYDSALDASYPDAHVAAAVLMRDTYLFGFHGDDVFYKTLQLKNEWTTVSAKVNLSDSRGAGAEVVEFIPGSTSLACKVRWHLDPTFLDPSELTYYVEITIQGPADFPPL